MPLKKIDKGIAKPGLEAALQTVMKELHRVVKEILQRFRDVNLGRPLPPVKVKESSSPSMHLDVSKIDLHSSTGSSTDGGSPHPSPAASLRM